MAEQHLTQHVIGPVDLELDRGKPGLTGVGKPALDDVANPVGSCVGHDDRIERDAVAPVGGDHRSFGAAELIEPEELTEIVGSARACATTTAGRLLRTTLSWGERGGLGCRSAVEASR